MFKSDAKRIPASAVESVKIFSYLAGNTASFIVTTLLAIIFIFCPAARLLRL